LSNFREIEHLITTKDTSKNANFSLAIHTGEDLNTILKNREEISRYFPKNSHFISLIQTHSSNVFVVDSYKSIGWKERTDIEADATITNLKGVVLTILTADCTPILLYEPDKKVIGAIHSGWRGTKKGIIKNCIKEMVNHYSISPENLIVGMAPSIRGCCYEVGDEVIAEFLDFPQAISKRYGNYYLDLVTVCKAQLLNLGVEEKNIEISQICTSCSSDRFFSYRKDATKGENFMEVIGFSDLFARIEGLFKFLAGFKV